MRKSKVTVKLLAILMVLTLLSTNLTYAAETGESGAKYNSEAVSSGTWVIPNFKDSSATRVYALTKTEMSNLLTLRGVSFDSGNLEEITQKFLKEWNEESYNYVSINSKTSGILKGLHINWFEGVKNGEYGLDKLKCIPKDVVYDLQQLPTSEQGKPYSPDYNIFTSSGELNPKSQTYQVINDLGKMTAYKSGEDIVTLFAVAVKPYIKYIENGQTKYVEIKDTIYKGYVGKDGFMSGFNYLNAYRAYLIKYQSTWYNGQSLFNRPDLYAKGWDGAGYIKRAILGKYLNMDTTSGAMDNLFITGLDTIANSQYNKTPLHLLKDYEKSLGVGYGLLKPKAMAVKVLIEVKDAATGNIIATYDNLYDLMFKYFGKNKVMWDNQLLQSANVLPSLFEQLAYLTQNSKRINFNWDSSYFTYRAISERMYFNLLPSALREKYTETLNTVILKALSGQELDNGSPDNVYNKGLSNFKGASSEVVVNLPLPVFFESELATQARLRTKITVSGKYTSEPTYSTSKTFQLESALSFKNKEASVTSVMGLVNNLETVLKLPGSPTSGDMAEVKIEIMTKAVNIDGLNLDVYAKVLKADGTSQKVQLGSSIASKNIGTNDYPSLGFTLSDIKGRQADIPAYITGYDASKYKLTGITFGDGSLNTEIDIADWNGTETFGVTFGNPVRTSTIAPKNNWISASFVGDLASIPSTYGQIVFEVAEDSVVAQPGGGTTVSGTYEVPANKLTQYYAGKAPGPFDDFTVTKSSTPSGGSGSASSYYDNLSTSSYQSGKTYNGVVHNTGLSDTYSTSRDYHYEYYLQERTREKIVDDPKTPEIESGYTAWSAWKTISGPSRTSYSTSTSELRDQRNDSNTVYEDSWDHTYTWRDTYSYKFDNFEEYGVATTENVNSLIWNSIRNNQKTSTTHSDITMDNIDAKLLFSRSGYGDKPVLANWRNGNSAFPLSEFPTGIVPAPTRKDSGKDTGILGLTTITNRIRWIKDWQRGVFTDTTEWTSFSSPVLPNENMDVAINVYRGNPAIQGIVTAYNEKVQSGNTYNFAVSDTSQINYYPEVPMLYDDTSGSTNTAYIVGQQKRKFTPIDVYSVVANQNSDRIVMTAPFVKDADAKVLNNKFAESAGVLPSGSGFTIQTQSSYTMTLKSYHVRVKNAYSATWGNIADNSLSQHNIFVNEVLDSLPTAMLLKVNNVPKQNLGVNVLKNLSGVTNTTYTISYANGVLSGVPSTIADMMQLSSRVGSSLEKGSGINSWYKEETNNTMEVVEYTTTINLSIPKCTTKLPVNYGPPVDSVRNMYKTGWLAEYYYENNGTNITLNGRPCTLTLQNNLLQFNIKFVIPNVTVNDLSR